MIFIKKATFKKGYEPFEKGYEIDFFNINLLVGDQGAGKSTLLHLLNNAKNKMVINKAANDIMSENYSESHKAQKKLADVRFMQDKSMAVVDEKGKVLDIEADGLFDEYAEIIDFDYIPEFGGNIRFLDTEAHNPRIKYSEYESKRPLLQELSSICKEIHRVVNTKDQGYVREIFGKYADAADIQHQDIDGNIINSHKSHGETILPMLEQLAGLKGCVILLDEPETSLSIRSQYKVAEMIHKIEANGNQLFVATHSPIIMQSVGEVMSLEHNKWMDASKFIETQK